MPDFAVHFFICNIFISIGIGSISMVRHLLKKHVSARILYYLWFFVLGLMAVPFLPADIFLLLPKLSSDRLSQTGLMDMSAQRLFTDPGSIFTESNDFAVSVSSRTAPIPLFLLILWISGMAVVSFFTLRSFLRRYRLEKSALPVQNPQVQDLYKKCCSEIKLKKTVPVYSTAFLASPYATGLLKTRIYLPIHLISDLNPAELRFILLHELQHCRQKDTFISFLMPLIGILYWFNPLVWYALREIQCDREIACDSAVLLLLKHSDHRAYGKTLINFAEKISRFPYTAGISGNRSQMEYRILNIIHFQQETKIRKLKGMAVLTVLTCLFVFSAPVLAFPDSSQYGETYFPEHMDHITVVDLGDIFSNYDGSFVLYDSGKNTWTVYHPHNAAERISPNSTYKIYDALLGLESGIITPNNTGMVWNGKDQPFHAWEADQTLDSAMKNSVNWYFQSIDSQLGSDSVTSFLQKIQYGNQQISSDIRLYWTDMSLKISPFEQVEQLKKLNENQFHFSPEHIRTVKVSILQSASPEGVLYGKTGTGRVDGKDISGWFIGFTETPDNVYYFATNIQNDTSASGSKAAEITASVLSKLEIPY